MTRPIAFLLVLAPLAAQASSHRETGPLGHIVDVAEASSHRETGPLGHIVDLAQAADHRDGGPIRHLTGLSLASSQAAVALPSVSVKRAGFVVVSADQ